MRRTTRYCAVKSITRVIFVGLFVCLVAAGPCSAQWDGSSLSSLLALSSLESIVGPIFPAKGLCSTFRSEVGTGARIGDIVSAKLTGAVQGEVNLFQAAFLDESPLRYDTYAILRFWRFGFRGAYSNAETRSRRAKGGNVDFSGLILGGDVDEVQLKWLTLGSSIDFYFINPRFQGVFITNPSLSDATVNFNNATLDLVGDQPITWGAYLRYVPPEILGFPMHLEVTYKTPLKGSKLTIYGAALVFRPQIYRFDVSCKLLAEKNHLKFQNETQAFSTGLPISLQNWELDMEWKYFGIEFAAYF